MKEQILKLRAEGKTYSEIKEIVGCSKGTIAYHCGDGQKEKTTCRKQSSRKYNPLAKKLGVFKSKEFSSKTRDFQRNRENGLFIEGREYNFKEKEVLEKIAEIHQCYLTGRNIDIFKPNTYHFDHIIPVTKGGDSSLDNLGVACKEANRAKSDLSVEEFILLCKDVLENFGYKVENKL